MLRAILVGLLLFFLCTPMAQAQGWDPREEDARSAKLDAAIERSLTSAAGFLKENPSLKPFFDEAYGYAVFPTVRKGGIIIGGARANGILFKDGQAEQKAYMTQYNLGLQFGARSFSQIIFFRDKYAYDRFVYGEFAPNASQTAILNGYGTAAAVDFSDDVAVFIRPRDGAMLEASIGAQNFGTRNLN